MSKLVIWRQPTIDTLQFIQGFFGGWVFFQCRTVSFELIVQRFDKRLPSLELAIVKVVQVFEIFCKIFQSIGLFQSAFNQVEAVGLFQ